MEKGDGDSNGQGDGERDREREGFKNTRKSREKVNSLSSLLILSTVSVNKVLPLEKTARGEKKSPKTLLLGAEGAGRRRPM